MKRAIILLLSVLTSVSIWGQTSVRVEVQNIVSIDEKFNVVFIIDGEVSQKDFSWSPGEDFQLVWGPQRGTSKSVSIVNGQRTSSSQTTFTYILSPLHAGKFSLPAATVTTGSGTLTSKSAAVEVAAGKSPSAPGSGSASGNSARTDGTIPDSDLFMRLTLSRTNVVIGEPVTATLKLYQRVDIAGFDDARFPTFNGFWSQETETPSNVTFSREMLGDEIYNSAVLRRWVLIPQQAGSLTIEPSELVCLVNIRVSGRSESIFDSFFEDNVRRIRKRVTTPAMTVNVRSLPAGAPASFGGGVGTYSLSVKLSKDSLKVHDAASLLVTVGGKGNVSLLQAPEIRFPADFEVYDVKTSENTDRASGGTSGSKTFEYPFIPRSHGDFLIPPVEYSYYDVDAGRYVTLKSDSLAVSVARGKDAPSAPAAGPGSLTVDRKGVQNLAEDIRFIGLHRPSFTSDAGFLVSRPLYWILIVLMAVAAAVICFVFRKRAALKADVAGSRNRGASKMAMKRLKRTKEFLDKDLQAAFYEELHRAMLGFVSDKLGMQVEDLTRDNISARLLESGAGETLAARFSELLDACEYARYAPDSDSGSMRAHYETAVQVISSLSATMKRKPSGGTAALLAVLLLAVPGPGAGAAENNPDSLWNAGVSAYQDGRWTDAVSAFRSLTDAGIESAAVWYNLGNASFKAGDMPGAILDYERALKLDPSHADARFNLEFARTQVQDRIDAVPEFILRTWLRSCCRLLSSNTWAVLSLLFLAGALSLLLTWLLGRNTGARKFGFFGGIAAALIFLICLYFAHWQSSDYYRADSAIVMRPVSSVKSSPSGGVAAKDLFVLHEGTKVRILDNVGDWCNIELADGRQGWIPTKDLEII